MTLCQKLVELGVYHSDGPGRPRLYDSSEESQNCKRLIARSNQLMRRAKIRMAKLNGEPSPTFPLGRRPLYPTKAEAKEAKLSPMDYMDRCNRFLCKLDTLGWKRSFHQNLFHAVCARARVLFFHFIIFYFYLKKSTR